MATNGNAPQFTQNEYIVSIAEGSPINTSVKSLTVSDRDTVSVVFVVSL